MEQSVVPERRETSCGLVRIGPLRKECVPRDGSGRLSYSRQERPAALAVGAVPGLGGAYGSGQGRLACGTPGAEVGDRTVPATRGACRTDQRAELHRGDRPAGRIRALWHVRLREPAGRGRGRLVGDAGIHASQHPPYVRVDDRVALSERETRYGCRRVVADAGEREQFLVGSGHLSAVSLDDRARRLMQPQRASGIAEAGPGGDGRARRLSGERGRCRPAPKPLLPGTQHPRHRCLLQHHLGDENPPGRRVLPSPGKIAGVRLVPGEHASYDAVLLLGHAAHCRRRRYGQGMAEDQGGTPEAPRLRDYVAWHDAYNDPSSSLSARLRQVQAQISAWLDRTPGNVRVLSSCAGQGHDILGVLEEREYDRARVSGALIELDSTNAGAARDWIARLGVDFEVVEADAGTTDAYAGLVPADLVLLSGIMGNISASDIERLIHVSRQFCAPGATVLWTRGAQELDLGQNIRRWFSEAGYAEIACQEGIEGTGMRVGVEQFTGAPEPLRPGEPVFTFYR